MKQRKSTSEPTYRIFLRSVPRSTLVDQRARAALTVGLGAGVQEFHGDQLDDWFQLARDEDVLVVECLEVIPPLRSQKLGGIPTNKLAEVHGYIKAKRLKLIEARTGREPDPERWKQAMENVRSGRRLTADEAKVMGRKGGERKPVQTIMDYWKSHPEHALFKGIWITTAGNYEDALEAVNAEARKRNYIAVSSTTMAWKVFGDRRRWKR